MPNKQRPHANHGPEAPYTHDELERIFAGAVSEENLERILALDPPLSPAADEREATMLFSDVRGATDLAGRLGMEEARRILNELLDRTTAEAARVGGYVDKYVGDEAMIAFGAPLSVPAEEQAVSAAALSLAIYRIATELDLSVGVGINTGTMAFGCFTPRSRPSYTAMGDAVNWAAFLEGWTRVTGGRPAITARVRDLIDGAFRTVFVVEAAPRRHPGPIDIYTIVARRDDLSPPEIDFWDQYDHAVALVADGRPGEALAPLSALSALRPDEALLQTAASRARKRYADSLSAIFAAAPGVDAVAAEVRSAVSTLFGAGDVGVLEPGIEGVWRFTDAGGLASRAVVMAPSGEAMIWLRGLDSAAPVTEAPETVRTLGFTHVAPFQKNNQLAGAVFLRQEKQVDLDAFTTLADALADPWTRASAEEMRERFREKVEDAEKLEEVVRELESKSVALERSLAENQELNRTLERRVAEHAARLERASSLKRYLPPSVVEEIIEGRRDLAPRTERRKITVMFSDVHGFTNATDGLEPEELARLLNNYLSSMSGIAFTAGATIDKFRGDGMMVFFGAPTPLEPAEGARTCLKMAIEMCREVKRLAGVWFDDGYDWDLGVRMGINTGYATVGEFGSADRLDYTVIGTEVNLAARLETACETNTILISHATWALVRDQFECEPVGLLEVKGIHRNVRAYRVSWE
jgi:adenylate cyclase